MDMKRIRAAASGVWDRWLRTGKLTEFSSHTALLTPEERAVVHRAVLEVRADYAARKAWEASAPRSTVDGRRIS